MGIALIILFLKARCQNLVAENWDVDDNIDNKSRKLNISAITKDLKYKLCGNYYNS